ncbi:MAG TPA: hypothetical protein PKB10_11865, partial [Tepidisphaeraceae bacterium]|nr:hypothetical protein [Tepidisphaeraceae bacterium]
MPALLSGAIAGLIAAEVLGGLSEQVTALFGAAAIGHPAEGAFLLFFFSLANALEHRAMDRARRAIAGLAELAPSTAIVVDGDEDRVTPIEQVRVGDRVRIKPGMRLPVDGVVVEGVTSIDQSPITAESRASMFMWMSSSASSKRKSPFSMRAAMSARPRRISASSSAE